MSLSHSSESTNLEKSADPSTDLSTISENRMDPQRRTNQIEPMRDHHTSTWRAWLFLWKFSLFRMLRLRHTIAIAFGLLLLAVLLIGLIHVRFGWDRTNFRLSRFPFHRLQMIGGNATLIALEDHPQYQKILRENAPLAVFSRWIVFFLLLGFLLPLWSLCFSVSALGNERESRTLIWFFTRPIPRWGIYLAMWLALLPWAIAFNVGGFWLICQIAGPTGQAVFTPFWPAILLGTIAFTTVFHLFASILPRPAIFGLLYAFFFETILSELPVPGTLKRLSINYYIRCLMYRPANEMKIPTESDSLFLPVSSETAWITLAIGTILLMIIGMFFFSRKEEQPEV